MSFKLSKRSLERLNNVDAILIAIVVDSITDSPYDFGIPQLGGFRTAAEQNSLYNRRPRVTYKDGYQNMSYHQTGKAFDIYAYVDGKATWDEEYYEPIARHIQKIALNKYGVNVTWGGDWSRFKDLPHFQI